MNISKIFCSLHLQGDPNYINLIHFKPQIRQNYKALPPTAKPMAYLNFLSNFLSENVNFHKHRAKNKKRLWVKPYEKRNFKERFQLDPFQFPYNIHIMLHLW